MVRKKEEKVEFLTRREADFIWDQLRIALEKLNRNQVCLHANQLNIMTNPESFSRGSAM